MKTIKQAGSEWLGQVSVSRLRKTYETYKCALYFFYATMEKRGVKLTAPVGSLNERAFVGLIEDLHANSVSTERLYITAIKQFYYFLMAEDAITVNREKINLLVSQRARRPGTRLPEFPEDDIRRMLEWVEKKMPIASEGRERLRDLRDRALILLLADTGLRIHEACNLKRGHINWSEKMADVIGKRNKGAVVRFSKRSGYALKKYLDERAKLDGATGREFVLMPVFARHDLAAGRRIEKMTTVTGRNIVARMVAAALGEIKTTITPHKFRHYFVTMIVNANDLRTAQELARHTNIATTAGYAHKSTDAIRSGYNKAIES